MGAPAGLDHRSLLAADPRPAARVAPGAPVPPARGAGRDRTSRTRRDPRRASPTSTIGRLARRQTCGRGRRIAGCSPSSGACPRPRRLDAAGARCGWASSAVAPPVRRTAAKDVDGAAARPIVGARRRVPSPAWRRQLMFLPARQPMPAEAPLSPCQRLWSLHGCPTRFGREEGGDRHDPSAIDYARPASLDRRCGCSPRARARQVWPGLQPPAAHEVRRRSSSPLTSARRGLDAIGRSRGAAHRRPRHARRHRRTSARRGPLPAHARRSGRHGTPQIRNWGTIGGSCAHRPGLGLAGRDPGAAGSFVCRSLGGERVVAARGFFDVFTTAIGHRGHQVRVPAPGPRSGGAVKSSGAPATSPRSASRRRSSSAPMGAS